MASNIIAGISLLVSISLAIFYIIDRSHNKFLLENDHAKNILQWHQEVTFVIKKLDISGRDRESIDYKNDLSKLSSLIEQGRFFFPNLTKGIDHGKNKPVAYRGYRNLALDFLVALHNLYDGVETDESSSDALTLQKHFTSIVFEIVNPKERLEKIQSLTDRYFLKEKSFEDFLNHKDSEAIKYIWQTK